MNLLAAKLYDPSTAASKATSSLLAMTAFDTVNLRLSVTVPAHGMLRFKMRCIVTGATTAPTVLLGVLNGATVVGRVAPQYENATANAATQNFVLDAEFTVTGLTPGATFFDAAYGVEVIVASTNIKYGGPNNTTTNDAWGGFLFEAWDPQPLPTAAPGASSGLQICGSNAATTYATLTVTGTFTVNGVSNVSQTGDSFVKFVGITSLAQWLGLLGGKQAGNATARTEMRATGAGSGGYDETTDSQEAVRDRGDAAWVPPSAAAVATAVWQDATAGDFTTANSIGKSIYNAFTANTSVFTTAALANAPTAGSAPTAAQVATAVWTDLLAGSDFSTASSIGKLLKDDIDATISSRLATSGYTAPLSAAGVRTAVGLASANLDTQLSTIAGYIDTEIASLLSGQTTIIGYIDTEIASLMTDVGTLLTRLSSLRAGYLDNLSAGAVAQAATALSTVQWTNGRGALLDNLDALVSSRLAAAEYTAPSTAAQNRDAVFAKLIGSARTMEDVIKLCASVLLAKSSGQQPAGTASAPVYRDIDDTKDSVSGTTDADGNRTAVTLNP